MISKYPIIIQGRISYEIHWNGCDICGEENIPQELAAKFMALMEELEQFTFECSR